METRTSTFPGLALIGSTRTLAFCPSPAVRTFVLGLVQVLEVQAAQLALPQAAFPQAVLLQASQLQAVVALQLELVQQTGLHAVLQPAQLQAGLPFQMEQ